MRSKHTTGPENGPQNTAVSGQKYLTPAGDQKVTIDLIPRKGSQRPGELNPQERFAVSGFQQNISQTADGDCPSDLAGRLRWWSRHHNWNDSNFVTNRLRLQLAFADMIRTAVNEFAADGRDALALLIKTEFAELLETAQSLDRACVKRINAKDEMVKMEHIEEQLQQALVDLAAMLESGYQTEAGRANEQWVSTTQAGKVLGVHRSTVAKWAKKGRFTDNGLKGQKKRLSMASVLLVKREIDNNCLKGYSDELQRDTGRIK